jgi:hypothetical protein
MADVGKPATGFFEFSTGISTRYAKFNCPSFIPQFSYQAHKDSVKAKLGVFAEAFSRSAVGGKQPSTAIDTNQ